MWHKDQSVIHMHQTKAFRASIYHGRRGNKQEYKNSQVLFEPTLTANITSPTTLLLNRLFLLSIFPGKSSTMPHTVDYNHLQIYIAICKPMDNGWVHWMVLLVHPFAKRCTYLHCIGAPGNRDLAIEDDKRFDSWSIEKYKYIATIPVSSRRAVLREAWKVPLQSCQLWVCYLMFRLERKGLVKEGIFDHFMYMYNHRMTENLGPGDDYPLGIAM